MPLPPGLLDIPAILVVIWPPEYHMHCSLPVACIESNSDVELVDENVFRRSVSSHSLACERVRVDFREGEEGG